MRAQAFVAAAALCSLFLSCARTRPDPTLLSRPLQETDVERAKKLAESLRGHGQGAVSSLIRKVCQKRRTAGLAVALHTMNEPVAEALIKKLHDKACQHQAAHALVWMGEEARATLYRYAPHPKFSSIVTQIIEHIDNGGRPTGWPTLGRRPSRVNKTREVVLHVGHAGGLVSMVATPDERYLITVGRDRMVKVWDVHDQTVQQVIGPLCRTPDHAMFVAATNTLVVTAGDTLYLWEFGTEKPMRTIQVGRRFRASQASSNGRYLGGHIDENTIQAYGVFNLETRTLKVIYEQRATRDGRYIPLGPPDAFHLSFFGHFSPDGTKVLYGNRLQRGPGKRTGVVMLHDLQTGATRVVKRWKRPVKIVRELVYDDVGRPIAAIAGQRLQILSGPGGNIKRTFQIKGDIESADVDLRKNFAVIMAADGPWFDIKRRGKTRFIGIDLVSGHRMALPTNNVLWLPKRKMLVAAEAWGKRLRFYTRDMELIAEVERPLSAASTVAVDDGGSIAAVGYREDSVVVLWDLRRGRPLGSFAPLFPQVTDLKFVPGEKQLVVTTRPGSLEVWDLRGEPVLHRAWVGLQTPRYRTLTVVRQDKRVIVRGTPRSIVVAGRRLREVRREAARYAQKQIPLTSIGFTVVVVANYADVRVFSLETGKIISTLEGYRYDVSAAHFLANGRQVVLGGPDWYGKWDADSGRLLYRKGIAHAKIPGYSPTEESESGSVTVSWGHPLWQAFASDPAGKMLFGATARNSIARIDPVTGAEIWRVDYQTPGGLDWVNDLLVLPARGELVTVHSDGRLRVWDMKQGHLRVNSRRIATSFVGVEPLLQRGQLVVASADAVVRSWSIRRFEPIVDMAWFKDSEWVSLGCNDYFIASPEGTNRIGWRLGGKVYNFARFAGQRRSEAQVASALRLGRCPAEEAPRLRPPASLRMVKTSVSPVQGGGLGLIRLQASEPIESVVATVNGALARKPVVQTRPDGHVDLALKLRPGLNQVRVTGVHADGRTTDTVFTGLGPIPSAAPGAKRPVAHVLAIGIGQYRKDEVTTHADRDAVSIFDALSTAENRAIWKVKGTVLRNNQVTRRKLVGALRNLAANVSRTDFAVIYLGGHGVLSANASDTVAFMVHDPLDPLAQVPLGQLLKEIDRIDCSVLIVLDICHAGKALHGTKPVTSERLIRLLNRRGIGAPVLFLSSKGRQKAMSDVTRGHGVFTAHLVAGLRGAADLFPTDGTVTLREIYNYTKHATMAATRGQQTPYIPNLRSHPNFPLTYVRKP